MYHVTKLVPQKIFDELLQVLPTQRQKRRGRPRAAKKAILNGILQVLINGVAWSKIANCGCSYSSCWRYFRELQRRGHLQLIYETLAKEKTDVIEGAIDTTTITSFRFKGVTGWDGRHKKIGTKVQV